jgi:hypothetical protein
MKKAFTLLVLIFAFGCMNVFAVGPNLSATPLADFGNVIVNTTAGPNTFTINGSLLTPADVTVAALSGFTYCTTVGGTYTTTLSLPTSPDLKSPKGPTTFSQIVYVKFSPLVVQSYNGNIVVGGGGVTTPINVPATGSGYDPCTGPSISGQSTASQIQCLNGTFAAITVSATGTNLVYQWYSKTDQITSGGTLVEPNSNTYTPSAAVLGTLYYYCVVSGDCGTPQTSAISGAFIVGSIGGAVTGTSPVCTGSNSGELTLSGHTGTILRWQSTVSPYNSWTNIVNTATTYTSGNLTESTRFRAVVKYGSCTAANSAYQQITVNPLSVGGSIAPVAEICSGSQPANLVLTGKTGNVVRWEKSTNILFPSPIDEIASTATTLTSATIGQLTTTTYFRAVVKSGACAETNSDPVLITVSTPTVAGSVTGPSAWVCSGSSSGELTLSGQTGGVVKWQSAVQVASVWTWSDIVNTATTYTSDPLTENTRFRAVVKSGACPEANSSFKPITARANPTFTDGSVSTPNCYGADVNFTGNGLLPNINNTFNYTVTIGATVVNGSKNAVSDALGVATYSETGLGEGTYSFKLNTIIVAGCSTTIPDPAVEFVVSPQLLAGVNGTVTDLACFGDNTGSIDISVSGGTPGYSYSWSTVPEQTAAMATGLTTGTYTVTITDANSCTTTASASITQPLAALSATAGILANVSCYNGSDGSVDVSVTGGTTVYGYEWSTDPVQILSTATGLSTGTYMVTVTDGNGCTATASVNLTNPPSAVGGVVSGGASVCSGINSTLLTLSGHSGTIVKWQYQEVPSGKTPSLWTDIPSTTNINYTATNLTKTTQYRAVLQIGTCPEEYSTPATVTVSADTRHYVTVSGAGTKDGSSWGNAFDASQLQSAISFCTNEVWVAAGTYKPTTEVGGTGERFKTFQMKNGVAIYGGFAGTEGNLNERVIEANTTILSGDIGSPNDNSDNSYHIFYHPDGLGLTNSAVLDGFTITGGNANTAAPNNNGGGMYNNNNNPILKNCTFIANTANNGGAMFNMGTSNVALINCEIKSNQATESAGGGFWIHDGGQITLTNCLVYNNTSPTYGGGMIILPGVTGTLINCTFSKNASGLGGGLYNSGGIYTINNSILWGNTSTQWGNQIETTAGISTTLNNSCFANVYGPDTWDVEGPIVNNSSISLNPGFINPGADDFRIQGNSPCSNQGNNAYNAEATDIRGEARIQNTTIDIGAYEWTSGSDPATGNVFVKYDATGNNDGSDWTNAYTSLQSALGGSLYGGDKVWVAKGSYYPSSVNGLNPGNDRLKHFRMVEGVSIVGSLAGNEDVTTYDLSLRDFNTNKTRLRGDIGTIGDSTDNCYHIFYHPDGLALSSQAVLDGFEMTEAVANGDNDLKDGGGMFNTNNSPTIRNCAFVKNSASDRGGAVYNSNSQPTFTRVMFERNYANADGGAIFDNESSSPIFTSCGFTLNKAQYSGGAVYAKDNSHPQYINCLLAYNSSTYGGASLCQSSTTFINSTISKNYAYQGGGISNESDAALKNCIIWGNDGFDGKQMFIKSGTTTQIDHSDYSNATGENSIAGSITGSGNIYLNPSFENMETGKFNIGGNSPCADAGNNTYCTELFDIRGTGFDRKLDKISGLPGGTIDMGAYEYKLNVDPNIGCVNPSLGGVIASNQQSCSAFDPALITSTSLPTGENGTLQYKWQSSTDSLSYTDLTTGTYSSTTYDPGSISSTTWYKRLAKVSCLGGWGESVSSNTVKMAVNAPPTAIIANTIDVLCYGSNTGSIEVSVSGGATAYNYVWSTNPAQTASVANSLSSGTYTVTVSDANNCSATASSTLSQPLTALTATASVVSNVSIYEGSDGSVTVSSGGGTTAYSYKWSTTPEQTTQAATGLTVGAYWVTVTDANSCSATSSIAITQPIPPAEPVVDVTITTVGSNLVELDWTRGNGDGCTVFMFQGNSGTAPPTNNVSYPANTVFGTSGSQVGTSGWYCVYDGTGTNVTVTGLAPLTDYRVHICEYKLGSKTYNTGTSPTNPANYTTYGTLLAAITVGENVSCNGLSDGTATVSASGGNPSYEYLWSTVPAQTAQTATGLSAGTYSVTVTDGVSATITSSIAVSQPDMLEASASVSKAVTCYQGSDGEITVSVGGGTTTYSYAWSTSPVQSAVTATGLSVGTYSVTVTDANGCTAASSASITQPIQWWPELTGPTPVCQNSTDNVYTTDLGMTDYIWLVSAGGIITSGGTGTDNTVTITWTGFGPQTVSVNYTSPAGCQAVAPKVKNVFVNIAPTPVITGEDNVTQSQVETYSTPLNPGNTYSWNASHGNPELCFPYRNCLTLTWNFPCGIVNPGYVRVTETNTSTGCSTTVTKWITIAP